MNMRISSLVAVGALALAAMSFSIPAAAQYREGSRHHDQDRQEQVCNYCGTVRSISRINTNSGRKNNTGAIIVGALIGGAVGNQVGDGDGQRAATVVGAVAGGAIANNATKNKNRRTIYRISVRMDNGRVYNFDQGSSNGMRSGSRVEVHDGRVYPAN